MNELICCKSFYNMGKSLNECLGCSYCMLKKYRHENMIYPDDVNIPISVNMFYGDPMLQINCTIEILEGLEKRKHNGPVIIVTKGNLGLLPIKNYNLDIYIGLSTDGNNLDKLHHNIKLSHNYPYKFYIEYRPIINSEEYVIDNISKQLKKHNIPLVSGGLIGDNQNVDVIIEKFKNKNIYCYKKTLRLIELYN